MQKREAARERETELEERSRELHNLSAKLGDKCQAVSSYQEAGKAERLQQVSTALQKLSQQLMDEEVKMKVRLPGEGLKYKIGTVQEGNKECV